MRFSGLMVAVVLLACSSGRVEPRVRYNEGLAALDRGGFEEARTALLKARDTAGADDELRYRAALALGLAFAREADELEDAEPEKALDLLRQSAAWFLDASRLKRELRRPREDLEKVQRRIQILADKLNSDGGGLEGALDRVIEEQRATTASIRDLLTALDSRGVTDPVGYRAEFDALATAQRTLVADVGALLDRAADERDLIEQQAEEDREEKDKIRLVQLQGAVHYLEQARSRQADTRRDLRQLSAAAAMRSAGRAVDDLKRAREQFLDPVAILKAIAADEIQLQRHSAALAELRKGTLEVEGQPMEAPPWLTADELRARQAAVHSRTVELTMRLASAESVELSQVQDPAERRMIESAVQAVPHVRQAGEQMDQALSTLRDDQPEPASAAQARAIEELLAAIELFAELRSLIELTHRDHAQALALLDPETASVEMTTAERSEAVTSRTQKNLARTSRMRGLIEDELATLAKAEAEAQNRQQPLPEEAAAEKARYSKAAELRTKAETALQGLASSLDAQPADSLAAARDAMIHIEELRRLFYSIVEHLKELRAQQAETGDRTSTAEAASDTEKAPLLGPLAESQAEHVQMGDAIAKALAAQADAAAQSQDPQASQQGERLAGAADEVRKALLAMENATAALTRARDDASSMSVSLAPALEAQPTALEHLDAAIALLEPPPQQDQQQQDQQQQDQQQQDQQQQDQPAQPQSEELSQQEAERRLQAIREREAERRRERNRPQPRDPVDKDW